MTSKLLVIDDHSLICLATEQLINGQNDLECVAACNDLGVASKILSQQAIDLTICDLQFQSGNALDFISQATKRHGTRFLVSSAHRAEVYGPLCQKVGAQGFIHKSCPADELLAAIRQIVAPEHSGAFVNFSTEQADAEITSRLAALTSREWEVLNAIGHGKTTVEMAKEFFVSAKTVESHRASLKRKLQISSKDLLVSLATELCVCGV